MAEQNYGSAGSRNTSSAATMASKVPLAPSHPSTVTADGAGTAPVAKGPSVQGFSGGGTIKAFVK